MKYISYLIVIIVLSVIGWATDNSFQVIFSSQKANIVIPAGQIANAQETKSISDTLDNVFGK